MSFDGNIVLFRPSLETKAIIPPWACIYLAKPLIDSGYKVDIIDALIDKQWRDTAKELVRNETLCVGASVLTGGCIKEALEFSEIVRNISKCPIVWGGVHCTILPKQTAKSPLIDYVIAGDGEESFTRFILGISSENLKPDEIPGLVYKDRSNQIRMNPPKVHRDLPDGSQMIPFETMNVDPYISPNPLLGVQRSIEIISSRGCPHRCTFCSSSRTRWRHCSADRVLAALLALKKRYKVDGVFFIDENFFVDRNRVEKLCRELIRHKADLRWGGNIRVDYFSKYDDAFINLLYESGCRLLEFGVESGDQQILRNINKDITIEQILICVEKLMKYPFVTVMNFMYGFPHESIDQIANTLSLILRVQKLNPANIIRGPSFYTPYPGTKLYMDTVQCGFSPPKTLEGWGEYEWHHKAKTWMHSAGQEKKLRLTRLFLLYYKLAKRYKWLLPLFNYRVSTFHRKHRINAVERILSKISAKILHSLIFVVLFQ